MSSSNRAQRLSGINPLAYLGVEPLTPPLLIVDNRAPTTTDVNGFFVGSIWVVTPAPYQVWFLVSVAQHVATWIQIYPISGLSLTFDTDSGAAEPNIAGVINIFGDGKVTTSGVGNTISLHLSGAIADIYHTDDGNNAIASAGILNVFGGQTGSLPGAGININTKSSGNTVSVDLNNTIFWPNTTADGLNGILYMDNNVFLHNFSNGVGDQNTFLGTNAGNLTSTGTNNVGIGFDAMTSFTTAFECVAVGTGALAAMGASNSNTAIGFQSCFALTTSDFNSAVGSQTLLGLTTGNGRNNAFGDESLRFLTTGAYNISIGVSAGGNYTGAESSNILLNSTGVLAESNTLRVGLSTGSGNRQLNRAFISGINGSSITATGVVQINASDQLSATNGTNGQVLIGGGTGPVWSTLTAGANITITNGANSISIASAGGGTGILAITGNSGGAVGPDGGNNINIVGTNVITVAGNPGTNTETISLTNGTNGQLLIGGGAAPLWANLTSVGATVTITNGANSINLEAVGGGGGTAAFVTDSGTANEVGGSITIAGGSNINTSGAGNTVTVNLDNTVSISGTFTSVGDITSSAGDFIGGNLALAGGAIISTSLEVTSFGAGVVQSNGAGNLFSSNGSNGQILIGGGGVPAWETITAGTGIAIANGPNSITISATGGGGGGFAGTRSFFAYPAADVTISPPSPAMLNYSLGALSVMLTTFDNTGGSFFGGDGIGGPAFFTAPATGIYQFTFQLTMRYNNAGSGSVIAMQSPNLNIITTARKYTWNFGLSSKLALTGGGFAQTTCWSMNTLADMNIGDTAIFNVTDSGTSQIYVIPSGGASAPTTFICGYRIA